MCSMSSVCQCLSPGHGIKHDHARFWSQCLERRNVLDLWCTLGRGGREYCLVNPVALGVRPAVSQLQCSQLGHLGGRHAQHAKSTDDAYKSTRFYSRIYLVRVAAVATAGAAEGSSCDSSLEPIRAHARWKWTGHAYCRIGCMALRLQAVQDSTWHASQVASSPPAVRNISAPCSLANLESSCYPSQGSTSATRQVNEASPYGSLFE